MKKIAFNSWRVDKFFSHRPILAVVRFSRAGSSTYGKECVSDFGSQRMEHKWSIFYLNLKENSNILLHLLYLIRRSAQSFGSELIKE